MELDRLVERYLDQEYMHHMEGERGVRNLAKLVNVLGYQDFSRYGQMAGGAALGDIFAFLEDNSGAIEALVEWIKGRNSPEWQAALNQVVIQEESDLVADHFKDCPDCGHEIPPDMVRGEECENCGHVFNWGPVDDSDAAWVNSDGQGA